MGEIQRWLYATATADLKALATGTDARGLASALGLAALFGLVHALMPGHGKVALVSYYAGHPARILNGAVASAVLILAHVGSAIVLVLAGVTVIRGTLGGAGRSPAFEAASAALVLAIGLWLLARAARHRPDEARGSAGLLAFAAGLVPCPLTTFIMVYASANGIVASGLLVTAAMATGMLTTIFAFAAGTIVLRERAEHWFHRTAAARTRVGRVLEIASALMIVGFGLWLFATRAV